MLTFFVEGHPQTAGSKTAIPARHPGGRAVVVESGDRKAKGAWRADVRDAARQAIAAYPEPWPMGEGYRVTFEFYRLRPKAHRRANGLLKDSAPAFPVTRPDALKVARAVEDALTGIVWNDDAAIVDERLLKLYGTREGCRVSVSTLP